MAAEHEQPFYQERMVSVEITRNGRLERLHFQLPEVAMLLGSNAAFLHNLDETLFQVSDYLQMCVHTYTGNRLHPRTYPGHIQAHT
jgi:hypothetical protein